MGWEEGGDTLETRGESVSEVPPARTTTWKSISRENSGGGGRRRRGFWCSSDYGGGEGLQSNEFLNMDPTGCWAAGLGRVCLFGFTKLGINWFIGPCLSLKTDQIGSTMKFNSASNWKCSCFIP